ncbi:MAG: acetyl-CoA carboxylase biotin carboxyl carrier protein subunit [Chloroflexi bacterium]|nr:acetyl-CoA carboxylase biotin carboxyl carrier protein subunit [Chloroflexota bacterium]
MTFYRVTLEGREYQVEIDDLDQQPVRAVVNGQPVDVWVEETEPTAEPMAETVSPDQNARYAPRPVAISAGAAPQNSASSTDVVSAPMPGSIISVAVKPGDNVETGQDLCVLEAMKMNNRIRAPRAGRIAEVYVSAGDQVQHGDRLAAYAGKTDSVHAARK